MTAANVIAKSRVYLNDPSGPNERWSDTTLLSYVDDAQRDFVSKSGILRSFVDILLQPNQAIYMLPDDCQAYDVVKANGKTLKGKTFDQMDKLSLSWESSTGTPLYYLRDKMPKHTLRISPVPTIVEVSDAQKLTVYYKQLPEKVGALTDLLDVSDEYIKAMEHYVNSAALRTDKDTANATKAQEEFSLYLVELGEAKNEANSNFEAQPFYSTSYITGLEDEH